MKRIIILMTAVLLFFYFSTAIADVPLKLYIATMQENDKGGMVMTAKKEIPLKDNEIKLSKKDVKVYIYAVTSLDDKRSLRLKDSKSGLSYGSWSAVKYVTALNKELSYSKGYKRLAKYKKKVSSIYLTLYSLKKKPFYTKMIFATSKKKAKQSPIDVKVSYVPDPEELAKEKMEKEKEKAKEKIKGKIKIW